MSVETAHVLAVRERAARISDGQPNVDPVTTDGDEPLWVGVARSPPAWFARRVDVSRPVFGLPAALRDDLARRRRDLRTRGLCEEGAHNAAWAELGLDERYREHLSSDATHEALLALAARGRPLVLATDRRPGFRCHRTVLAARLRARE
jgi:hypothetical protein